MSPVERIKRFSLGTLVGLSALILVIAVVAAVVINSGALDLLVKNRVVSLFNDEYRGRLELREVRLNFPNRVLIVEPRIFGEGEPEPALAADRIALQFNFLSLLKPKIRSLSFRSMQADGFRARIIERNDGRLNIEELFTPRDPDRPQEVAIEKFRCRLLSVRNGSILYLPRKTGGSGGLRQRIDVRNLRLDAGRLLVRKQEIRARIGTVRFTMPEQGFTLKKGSADVRLSAKRTEVLSLDLETAKSVARLSVSVDGFNIFAPDASRRLPGSRAFLHVQSLRLHTDDLDIFRPVPELPRGLYTLGCNAKGTLGRLQLMDVRMEHGRSALAVQGELQNLQDRNRMSFRLQIDSSRISQDLLQAVLKEQRGRKLAEPFGTIEASGAIRGTPDAWTTELVFSTGIGRGSLAADVAREPGGIYRTEGSCTVEQAELHRLAGLDPAKSVLNCSGSFGGRLNIRSGLQEGRVEAAITNSFWQKQAIGSGSVLLAYSGGLLSGSATLQNAGGTSLRLEGRVDFSAEVPSYQAGGEMAGLDLSKILASGDFTTDLNGTVSIQGRGFDAGRLNASADMVFTPSSINGFRLKDKARITAGIVQGISSSAVTVRSDFLDLTAEGNASFRDVLDALRLASDGIRSEIRQQDVRQAGRAAGTGLAPAPPKGRLAAPFTVDYRITLRDLAPLVILSPVRNLQMQASASGKAAYADGRLTVGADIGITELRSAGSFSVSDVRCTASVQCTSGGAPAASLTGSAAGAVFGGRKARNARLKAEYSRGRLTVSADLEVPAVEQKVTASLAAVHAGPLWTVTVGRLTLAGPGSVWQADPGSTFDIGGTFSRFNRFRLWSENQQIELDGILSSSQPGTFRCSMSNVDLGEVRRFTLDPSLERLSGRANGVLSVSGRPGSKTTALELRAGNVVYDDILFGSVRLTAEHTGDRLRFDLDSRAAGVGSQAPNTLTGSGTIPLVLTFSPFSLRIPDHRPLQASVQSENLSARLLEYLLPFFESAEGTVPVNLRIGGTTPKPDIYLTARLNDTRMRVAPTQVSYLFTGELKATPSQLDIRNLRIRDTLQGTGSINGIVRLEGLEARSADLAGVCRNLLLFNRKDRKDDSAFGTITGSTGNFRLSGDLSAPTAEGELNVTSADFTLCRTGSNESAKYIGVEKFIEFVPRFPAGTVRAGPPEAPKAPVPEFYFNLIDILQISNLRLTGAVPMRYTMIFDRERGEKLETAISNLSLNVNKSRQRYRLFGSVDITGGKYKFSNSNFDLEDGGRITWNNEEIRDGAMVSLYGSKYMTASDVQTGERDNVKLLLAIGGTLNEPNVRMGYYLNDNLQPYSSSTMIGRQSSQIDPNAELNVISMLLSRQWYVHPDRQGRTANIPVSSVGLSAGTGMLSSQISGFVQEIAGLESFNVNLAVDDNGALSGMELYFALTVPGTAGKVRFIGTGSTPNIRDNALFTYYGTSQRIEYRVTPKLYVEAYRSYGLFDNGASGTNLQKPAETWGASLSFREKFHDWSEFWNRIFGSSDQKE
jgi:hypothetical protein